jgi:hypothetical protein
MRIGAFSKAICLSVLVVTCGVAAASANNCRVPLDLRLERPDSDGPPTRVEVGVFVLDILRIDERAGTFDVDMFAAIGWRDPRLSAEQLGYSLEGCRIPMQDVWHPAARILNRKNTDVASLTVDVDAEGNVRWAERVSGTLGASLDLREFPFDTQELSVQIMSFQYGPEEVELVSLPATGRREAISLSSWSIGEVWAQATAEPVPSLREDFARIDVIIPIKRVPNYYLWKIVLPLSLIVCMAWTVFWLDPANLNPQISVSTASVFTLVAFLMSLGQLLPPESYLTRLDKFVLGCTLMVFLALGEAVTTSRLAATNRHALSLKVDRAARVLYFVLFAAMAFFTLKM